jgi:hypothetical protein
VEPDIGETSRPLQAFDDYSPEDHQRTLRRIEHMFMDMRQMAAQASGTSRMIAMLAAAALGAASGHAQVANGDFSSPSVSGVGVLKKQSEVAPWKTTDSKGEIEIWQGGAVYEGKKWDAPAGLKQFAEVNANSHSTLSQVVNGIPAGAKYGFSFYHRGRHSATEGDSIEVTVNDGGKVWKNSYTTSNTAWKQYTAVVGTKNGGGPVTLSFRSVSIASSDPTIGNFLTGIKLDQTVVPPPCVINAGGNYDWTTDNTKTTKGNGKKENVGTVTLKADQSATNNSVKGKWQVSNECGLTINWENGRFIDVLRMSADGKTISGTNQIGTIITGIRK